MKWQSEFDFAINPTLDVAELARRFAACQRMRIADFLAAPGAEQLADHLLSATQWRHVISSGERVFEIPAEQLGQIAADERARLDQALFREAAHGFRFRYDTIRVPDGEQERAHSADLLNRFASFMASSSTIEFFRQVTRRSDPCFADAQATRYCCGDFLTRHDDAIGGKDRTHAYVLGLTAGWRSEWGGLLLFNGSGDQPAAALSPSFNSLDLFSVGQPHSVSYVAPYAPRPRISVTGWLRSRLA